MEVTGDEMKFCDMVGHVHRERCIFRLHEQGAWAATSGVQASP